MHACAPMTPAPTPPLFSRRLPLAPDADAEFYILFALWALAFVLGLVLQHRLTGRNHDHRTTFACCRPASDRKGGGGSGGCCGRGGDDLGGAYAQASPGPNGSYYFYGDGPNQRRSINAW